MRQTPHRKLENYLMVRFLGCSWMDKRRAKSLATVRKKSSGDHSKRFQEGEMETLPRAPESSWSCHAGSASATASELKVMVERTRMAKVRRREMAWISWFGTARFIGSKRHWIRVERCGSQLSYCHYNKQEIWLESRADFHMESATKENSLDFPIHSKMSE